MFEQFILGAVQGMAEWLPVSSEGIIFLIKTNFFNTESGVSGILRDALFLHFGTFLASLVYFRKDVIVLVKAIFNFKKASQETKNIFIFLLISTLISGSVGYIFVKAIDENNEAISTASDTITVIIGCFLLITAFLQFKQERNKNLQLRGIDSVNNLDGVVLGLTQAFAAMPGLSRSGLTVSALFMRKFNQRVALKLSFLMSMPIVLGGNIVLNLDKFNSSQIDFIGVITSFIFGLITIKILLKFAEKINFSLFVFIFAILTIFSVFL